MKGVFVMAIDTYEYRKAHGLCVRCGKQLSADEKRYSQCTTCRESIAERTRKYRQEKDTKPITMHSSAYTPPAYSLSDVTKMAMANGLSYGNMVAILDGRTALRRVFHYGGVTKITPKCNE